MRFHWRFGPKQSGHGLHGFFPRDPWPPLALSSDCKTKELQEYSIPYEEILPVLEKGGYTGYLSSEYEGKRDKYRTSTALRAHHAMCRSILQMTV